MRHTTPASKTPAIHETTATNAPNGPSTATFSRRALAAAALAAAGMLALAGCSSGGSDSAASAAAGSGSELAPVSFALDWAPNTNHIGVFVADELGYFEEAGIDVEILPYGSASAMQLVSAGEADFSIGGQSNVQMARTSGLDVRSVYAITQTDTGRLVVLGDRDDVTRPADLDGLTFGGFGAPLYTALAAGTIEGDGGSGEFEEVVLDTGAYEALSQGRIDFTLSVATWENLKNDIEGHPYKEFKYQEFGVPDQQSTGIVSSEAFLDENPEEAKAFVQAVAKGYQYAADHPEEAAELLIKANPDSLGTAKELVKRSAQMMADEGFLVSPDRPIGAPNPEAWNEFGEFLFNEGFLVDAEGKPLETEPDWSGYYTDKYLG